MKREVAKTVLYYATISERIMCLKLQTKHQNMLIIQVYAPNEVAEETEKVQFNEELKKTIKEYKNQEIN